MRVVEDLIQPVIVMSVRLDMFSELIFMMLPKTAVEFSLQLFAKLGRDGIVGGKNVKVRPILIRLGTGGREAVRGTFFVAVTIVRSVSAAAVVATVVDTDEEGHVGWLFHLLLTGRLSPKEAAAKLFQSIANRGVKASSAMVFGAIWQRLSGRPRMGR